MATYIFNFFFLSHAIAISDPFSLQVRICIDNLVSYSIQICYDVLHFLLGLKSACNGVPECLGFNYRGIYAIFAATFPSSTVMFTRSGHAEGLFAGLNSFLPY